ncbi:hypothetical protein CW751_00760 [Brumimicrobium salinarum]|uniref:Gliding motility protein RemB n=1 Tax=Brumimicrobium salinarum TaxID=2058658 RepID=A0A2I0R5R3_9FLAO|nr:hypothetical protein [Brumimicrobium salinarum]PKR81899.1 hypothetical protein CW751_00760 [Brumimicrobium salinarum]
MKKFNLLLLISILLIKSSIFSQEILLPISSNVKDQIILSAAHSDMLGEGFFPVSYSEAQVDFPKKDTTRTWIYRKLFQEHFIQPTGKHFLLAVDPVLNLSIGKDVLNEGANYIFQNTRGVQAQGHIQNIFSFYTAFFENQGRYLAYQTDYFTDRGEYYPKNGVYTQTNAVIPGGGRTKPFKVNGFDYASSVSYVRLTPNDKLTFQFGNAPRFFGYGHRSLLLSDNSFNYTHLSIDWKITPKLSYTLMRGKQLNLIRKVHTNLIEAPYERKGIGVHYLNYKPIPTLSIGVFESTVYLRDEATSSQRVNPYFYQPLIGINTALNGSEISDLKNLLGVNIGWRFHPKHLVYLQTVTDDFKNKAFGFQLGYRNANVFGVKKLHFQAEYNHANKTLYAANNPRLAYTHFNLPLAHTLGNGFKEVVIRLNYEWKGFFTEVAAVFYDAHQPMTNKSQLFESKLVISPNDFTRVLNGHFKLGYVVNPATQLRVFLAGHYRESSTDLSPTTANGSLTIGMRTAINNQYFDF